jgi:hypothetical protein
VVICILLKRHLWQSQGCDWVEIAHWDGDTISTPDGTFSDWATVAVTWGWRDWYYSIFRDGT